MSAVSGDSVSMGEVDGPRGSGVFGVIDVLTDGVAAPGFSLDIFGGVSTGEVGGV
jgi:hypothetical protein